MAEAAQTAGAFEKPVSERGLGAEWYGQTSAVRYQISSADFDRILQGVAQKYLPAGSSGEETRQFCAGLHHEELVLAQACVAGHEKAWEDFLTRYREKLYDMALRIARENSAARDLADSIYGELYGLNTRDGVRVSKLSFYTGRGSLEGWLRTVLAQEFVNRYRKTKRLVSLDESVESDDGEQRRSVPELAEPVKDHVQAPDPRLSAATDEALAALQDDERFILAAYYLDGRTLAQIAGMLHVHESTISRKVEKLGKVLRKQILSRLKQRGMSRRQAEEAMEVDVRDVTLDLRARLQDPGSGAFYKKRKAEGKTEKPE
jgi:RNA polymerase sigma-70 factor (ECF subfamily)